MAIDDIVINNIPSIQEREIGYRTVSSSKDQNDYQNEIFNDVLDLFNKSNKIEKSLDETESIIDTENRFLQMKFTELENFIASLTEKYTNLSQENSLSKYLTIYPGKDTVTDDTYGAYVDVQNMDITMKPIQSSSKTSLYDSSTDSTFVPSSLRLEVSDNVPASVLKGYTDNDPIRAFNNDPSSYWIREVITDNTINEVICTLTVTLPEDIITTRDINTIIINPYPVNALDIVKVQYKAEGSWVDLPCFESHANSSLEEYADVFGLTYSRPTIQDAPNIKLNFKEINANQLQFIFRQRHFLEDTVTGKRTFYLGAKTIEILQNKYEDFNSFTTTIELPSTSATVQGVEVLLNNSNELSNNTIQYEFFSVGTDNTPVKIITSIPFVLPTLKMMIRVKIYKGLVTPNIRALRIKYQTV